MGEDGLSFHSAVAMRATQESHSSNKWSFSPPFSNDSHRHRWKVFMQAELSWREPNPWERPVHSACRVRSPDALSLITLSEFGSNYESCGVRFSKPEDSALLSVMVEGCFCMPFWNMNALFFSLCCWCWHEVLQPSPDLGLSHSPSSFPSSC